MTACSCGAVRERTGRGVRFVAAVPARAWLIGVLGAIGLAGCTTQQRVPAVPLPTAEQISAGYNARVAGLDRIWARAIVRFESLDRDGNEIDEQGEGHLQLVRPRSLYLTIGKLGEPAFELGSNDARYWWIDIRNKSARVGVHERATPESTARAGLPVHPLDLPELLGITPLEGATPPRWSADGISVEVSVGGRWGDRVVRLDPVGLEPTEIELRDREGKALATATLTEYEGVILRGEVDGVVRLATRILIEVPSTSTRVTLWLREPENRGSRIKPRAFNFDLLAAEYGVTSVVPIDGPATPQGRGTVN